MEKVTSYPKDGTKRTLKNYILLTKPGIIFGNVITTIGGYGLAYGVEQLFSRCIFTLLGIALIIAAACVYNNFIDRHFDQKMQRTKNRPFVTRQIASKNGLIFGSVLLCLGACWLGYLVNTVTMLLAVFGFVFYVFIYSYLKYLTKYGTLIGSVAGAIPPVVGYYAAANRFDFALLGIFLVVAFWQMPHFYAIAIYRLEDYRNASIPVWPLKKGIFQTKIQMVFYIILFGISCYALYASQNLANRFLWTALGASTLWFILGLQGFKAKNNEVWARQMFIFSLIVIMSICAMIPLSH